MLVRLTRANSEKSRGRGSIPVVCRKIQLIYGLYGLDYCAGLQSLMTGSEIQPLLLLLNCLGSTSSSDKCHETIQSSAGSRARQKMKAFNFHQFDTITSQRRILQEPMSYTCIAPAPKDWRNPLVTDSVIKSKP